MANNDPGGANGHQRNMTLPSILGREANRVVSERYSKLHTQATGNNGVEGLAHLSRGYRDAIDQGYEVIDERHAEVAKATEGNDEPRSVKRNRMKQMNVEEESPPDGRGVRARGLSFGAALNKVPAPIWTQHKPVMSNVQVATPDEMRDPKLPSINQQLARLAIPEPTRESTGHGIDLQRAQSQSRFDIDPFDTDPYKDKADEIGLSHGFSGKGFLELYLTPLGWREGDPPINHTEARQLFDHSRNQQREVYLREIERTRHINTPQHHALSKQKDEAWAEAYNFDKFILRKRKEIYNAYLQRQVEKEYEQQVKDAHVALYPSLSARHVQADVLRLPSGVPSFISPSVLDPRLVLNSFQAVYTQYTANKEKISRWNDANEYFMTTFNTVYGDVLQNANLLGNLDTHGLSSSTNGMPLFDIPDPPGHEVAEPHTRGSMDGLDVNGRPLATPLPLFPLPEVRYRGLPNDRQSLTLPRLGRSQTPSIAEEQLDSRRSSEVPRGRSTESRLFPEYPTPTIMSYNVRLPESNIRRGLGSESRPVTPPLKKGRSAPASRKVSTPASRRATMPTTKQRVLKPQPSKSQPWYQAQMDAANLPTNIPSRAQMEKLLKEAEGDKKKPKANTSKDSTPSRRKRKRTPVDMKQGIAVSAAAAEALHKAGAPWAPGSEGGFLSESAPLRKGATQTGPIVFPDEVSFPRRATAASGSHTRTDGSGAPTASASPFVSGSNTTSELSSLDDPEDETFVPGGKRKAADLASGKKRSKADGKDS